MLDATLTISANAPSTAVIPSHTAQPGFFDHFLSELNPLQYVPVVGTIYRAVTGDTISESARFAGSLVVSGLTGGPVGIGLNVGTTLLEHMLGIDPEKIGDALLHQLGIGGTPPQPAQATAASAPAKTSLAPSTLAPSTLAESAKPAPATPPPVSSSGWSAAQLAAYGVRQGPGGSLTRGNESGADVLNSLELTQLRNLTTPVAS